MKSPARITIALLAAWLILSTTAVTAIVWPQPKTRAVLLMGWGLILIWCFAGGWLQYHYRNRVRPFIRRVPLNPTLLFVLFATTLFCLEEAVTTTMTNCAPLLGVRTGEAYITASTNYLRVILLHSGPGIVPLLIGWAIVLRIWAFRAFAVFLMFGLTGAFVEATFLGFSPGKLATFGLWVFVYGNMIWLPAYCLPDHRGARPPSWWAYPLAPILAFLIAIPLIIVFHLLANALSPAPTIEFPAH